MIEVEIKLEVRDLKKLEEDLIGMGYVPVKTIREEDAYYDGGINGIKKSGQALRVRRTVDCLTGEEQSAVTFKGAKIDHVSMARVELETLVGDGNIAKEILKALGFQAVCPCVVKMRKVLEKGTICACLDDVEGLGTFLELETIVECEEERPGALCAIEDLLHCLGYELNDTTRTSYLSQLQRKMNRQQTVRRD